MKKKISLLLTILWMVLIFILSSASSSESNEHSGWIVNFIAQIFNINNLDMLSYIIRKIAHVLEFAMLGILVMNLISCYNKKMYLALIICVLYAVSDEIHQIFVPGRNSSIIDVLIDSVGSFIGIYIYKVIIMFKNKIMKQ